MYEIYFKPQARRQFKKLPRATAAMLRTKIDQLAANPYTKSLDIKKLVGREGYRLRVADYRILYRVLDDRLIIEIVAVGHRREIYH